MHYLTILTDDIPAVHQAIQTEFRLGELVQIAPLTDTSPDVATLLVSGGTIQLPFDWSDNLPPVLLPRPLPFSPENLLSVVFMRLDNWEKAYEYARHGGAPHGGARHGGDNPLLTDAIDLTNRLQAGVLQVAPARPIDGTSTFDTYQRWHNRAVALHYGNLETDAAKDDVAEAYQLALRYAPDAECRAYTTKQYATLLLDTGQLTEANNVLAMVNVPELSSASGLLDYRYELLAVQYAVWLQQLVIPYDASLLEQTKTALWHVLEYYEARQRPIQVGLLLVDSAQVANFTNSFAEALGYISRALTIFRDEDVPELLANAQYRKGVLLYTWAQNGNPQFYRPAMEAYQAALKVFTQQNAPAIFAEIQHHLGVIFAEIPDEVKKKSIWAAVSSSSFQQAMAYFNREEFPYEYATICNHYANALTKYPPAAKSDNYAKAIGYYRDALRVRTADTYPYERALTILNYLESGWYVGEDDPQNQRALYNDMVRKASEVRLLVADEALLREADQHLQRLGELII
ncbi:tetratricopeptide repeat protein [Spirosoma flavum]|uniref:Tetratricopeptide repeat protein n=1 Tax=Spirosoma flavum TaxID=2048557 RepID=A0ABW6AIL9_9BACT